MDKKGYNFEMLPVDDITLDFNNPRIAMWVEMYGKEIASMIKGFISLFLRAFSLELSASNGDSHEP